MCTAREQCVFTLPCEHPMASAVSATSNCTEGDVVITQDLVSYEITGEDENGKLRGKHVGTGVVRPNFWERARYYNLEKELADALDKVNQ